MPEGQVRDFGLHFLCGKPPHPALRATFSPREKEGVFLSRNGRGCPEGTGEGLDPSIAV